MLNLFTSIILEGFSKQLQQETNKIQDDTFETFTDFWVQYDPYGQRMINVDDLKKLLLDIVSEELRVKELREKLKKDTQ